MRGYSFAMHRLHRLLRRFVPLALLVSLSCDTTGASSAPPQPPPQAPPAARGPAPAPDDDIQQTVARISFAAGGVSFSRGDDPETWQPADVNVPMTLGDRVWTGDDGRLELQVHGGNFVRLGARTDLQALNLTNAVKQLSLSVGTASFTIRRLGENEVFEVDTPNAAVTLERPGEYRVDVDENGNSRVQVRRGRALASAGGGQVALAAGEELDIEGIDAPRYQVVALPAPDGWDGWVAERDQRVARARSYTYVTADIAGVEDLDQYGRWQQIPDYGWAWTPAAVDVGWTPYRTGRWIWQDPWGWTWVAAEPWGWAPYHYGRWTYWGSGWYWVPVAPTVQVVAYSPALVAFVGGSGGYVGWFPLAPRDPYYAWYRRSPAVNVTNVTYVNRTYVTVVNQTVFVSGRSVGRDIVRDRTVIRSIESAPVLRGPVPVVPTRQSLRTTAREAPAARPPAAAASRQVVTRVAPPPAPPRFDAKLAVIREKGGAPVGAAEAARLSSQEPQPVARSRPAAPTTGAVTLAPKGPGARPEPTVPARGNTNVAPLRPTPQAPERATPPPKRASEVEPPQERPRSVRPTPRPVYTPVRPPAERREIPPTARERSQPMTQVTPIVRERPQPADRIAPPPQERQTPHARPTPKPSPTKAPKK